MEVRIDNLPSALTRFFGRTQEIEDIKERLARVRLLTLSGIGGVGKTRLALQVANEILDEYPDGVWFVELASLSEPAFVSDAVSSVLGLRELAGRTVLSGLKTYLRDRKPLLILDNCEHLIESVAGLANELLTCCPELTILATSREPLGISGEATLRIAPLPVPDQGSSASHSDVLNYAAIALLADRARLVQSSFELSDANLATIIKICDRLDGIPLAIELACAKLGFLPVEEVSTRLDDRFRLLAGNNRSAVGRQQTLQATLDWSYDLLNEEERSLLGRLSVFSGGAGLEAIAAVCPGEAVGLDVLHPLSQLVNKSLVTLTLDRDNPRYRLLETVRSYASQRLLATGEESLVRYRHLEWYLAMAEAAYDELGKANQGMWFRRLDREYENLRTALDWSMASRSDEGIRLAVALTEFWFRKGSYTEGLERLQRALATSTARTGTRAVALTAAGEMARRRGDHHLAHALAGEAIRLAEEVGDESAKAWAVEKLALILDDEGAEEWLAVAEEGVALCRRANPRRLVSALNNLGLSRHYHGDRSGVPRAELDESLALARECGDHWSVASVLDSVAEVALDTADFKTARMCWNESLSVSMREGYDFFAPIILEGLAKLALVESQPERALRLLGAADRVRRELGLALSVPIEGGALQRLLLDARNAVPSTEAEIAWAQGESMPLHAAVRYAAEGSEGVGALAGRASASPGARGESSVRTFLFTDIVGSTALVEAMGDDAWNEVLRWHDETLRRVIQRNGGEQIKHVGDGIFASFDQADPAIQTAVEIQRTLAEHRQQHGFAPQIRIGVHSAPASRVGVDYRGRGVHQAARIAAAAQADEILVSWDTAEPSKFVTSTRRALNLKGIAAPVQVVSVTWR